MLIISLPIINLTACTPRASSSNTTPAGSSSNARLLLGCLSGLLLRGMCRCPFKEHTEEWLSIFVSEVACQVQAAHTLIVEQEWICASLELLLRRVPICPCNCCVQLQPSRHIAVSLYHECTLKLQPFAPGNCTPGAPSCAAVGHLPAHGTAWDWRDGSASKPQSTNQHIQGGVGDRGATRVAGSR